MITRRNYPFAAVAATAVVTLNDRPDRRWPCAGASPPEPVATATQIDPIVGDWETQGGVIHVTGSGSDFTGVVTQATSFNQCTHPSASKSGPCTAAAAAIRVRTSASTSRTAVNCPCQPRGG